MRPPLPVPPTWAPVRLLSAISLAAAGMATPDFDAAAAGTAAAAAGAACGAEAAAVADAGTARPSVSIFAMTSPLVTVEPLPLTISAITPADGAGTSSTTLSVSISMRISSTAMDSPGFFFHCCNVASATDSLSCGTLTSMIAISSVLS